LNLCSPTAPSALKRRGRGPETKRFEFRLGFVLRFLLDEFSLRRLRPLSRFADNFIQSDCQRSAPPPPTISRRSARGPAPEPFALAGKTQTHTEARDTYIQNRYPQTLCRENRERTFA
jgi:hypothetical protein